MSKLDNFPKKQAFNVPDGYFDTLPLKVQARLPLEGAASPGHLWSRVGLRYVLPAAALLLAVFFYFKTTPAPDALAILSGVPTTDLVQYLGEYDWTTDDLIEQVSLDGDEVGALENEIFDIDVPDPDDVSPGQNLNIF